MASSSQTQQQSSTIHQTHDDDDEHLRQEALNHSVLVTTELHLKPPPSPSKSSSSSTLDKDVVLRRIRHMKRVNKVRDAVQSFLTSRPRNIKSAAAGGDDQGGNNVHDEEVSDIEKQWLAMDAFSSPFL